MDSAAEKEPAPLRRRRFLIACAVLAVWVAWILTFWRHAVYNPILREGSWGVDYQQLWFSAVRIMNGEQPYCQVHCMPYPQFTLWVHLFLGFFSYETGEIVANVWNAVLTLMAFVILMKACRPRRRSPHLTGQDFLTADLSDLLIRHWHAVAALAFTLYCYAYMDLTCANVEALNVFLLIALTGAMLRGRESLAGLLLAALCLVKVVPLIMLPAIWLAGWRRAIAVCAGALAVYAAVLFGSEIFRPGDGWWRWELYLFRETLPSLPWRFRGLSGSIVEILARFVFPRLGESKPLYDLAARAVGVVVAGAYLAVLWFARARLRAAWRDGLSLASMTVVIVSPLVEGHHFVWAMPAYVLLIVDYVEGRTGSRWFLSLFLLWMLILACRLWVDVGRIGAVHPYEIATLLMVLLWSLTAARMLVRPRRAGASKPKPGAT